MATMKSFHLNAAVLFGIVAALPANALAQEGEFRGLVQHVQYRPLPYRPPPPVQTYRPPYHPPISTYRPPLNSPRLTTPYRGPGPHLTMPYRGPGIMAPPVVVPRGSGPGMITQRLPPHQIPSYRPGRFVAGTFVAGTGVFYYLNTNDNVTAVPSGLGNSGPAFDVEAFIRALNDDGTPPNGMAPDELYPDEITPDD